MTQPYRSFLEILLLVSAFLLGACSSSDGHADGTDTGSPMVEVTGQVFDLSGSPVANAQVSLHGYTATGLAQSLARLAFGSTLSNLQTQTTTTDAQGYYTVSCACSGKAYVVADLADSLAHLDSLELDTAATGTTVKNLPLQPKGILRIERGAFPAGASIYVLQLNLTLTLDSTGLERSVPPGQYLVTIQASDNNEPVSEETTVQEKGTGLVTGTDTAAQAPVPNQTLLAAWEFNTPAQPGLDNAVHGLHAQIGEGSPSVADTTLRLDGASGLRAPLSSALQRNNIAIEARIFPTSFGAQDNILVAEPPGSYGDGWILRLESGKATFHLRDQSTHGTQWQTLESPVLTLNSWTTLRVERLGATTRLWINDSLVASQAIAGDIGQLEYDLGIGFDAMKQAQHDRYFSGQIDYLRIIAIDSLTDSTSTGTAVFGTMTDSRDLRTYKTVTIGSQVWMAENLNYGILDTASSTLQNGSVKYCYQNLDANCTTDGGLYQWQYAMGLPDSCATTGCSNLIMEKHQGICPDGWHMPDSADWDSLGTALGGADVAGATMKLSTTGYTSFDATTYNDGNSSGFSAYPAGIRYFSGSFAYHGGASTCGATFWEAEEESTTLFVNAYRRIVNDQGSALTRAYNHAKADAFSIRCVQD